MSSIAKKKLSTNNQNNRETALVYKMNILLAISFLAIAIIDFIYTTLILGYFGIASIRINILWLTCIFHIYLLRQGKVILSKISMVFCLPFLLIILPTVMGDVQDEYFFWYPFIPVIFSVAPHLIFTDKAERHLLYITLFLYLILTLLIDRFLILFGNADQLNILPIVSDVYLFYKLTTFVFFVTINLTLFYLFNLNRKYELSLREANSDLTLQSRKLKLINEEILAQKEELASKNTKLNDTLEQLKNTQSQLLQSEKMASIGVLISGIAHELNNPLNYIQGSQQLLDEMISDLESIDTKINSREEIMLEIKRLTESIHHGTDRITNIVKDLQIFSHQDTLDFQPIRINKFLETSLQLLTYKIPDFIRIEKNYRKDPVVMCNPEKMQQVFINILDNAVFAIKSKVDKCNEIISICTDIKNDQDEYVSIILANSGPLIAEEELSKVFDPFFTTKDAGEGTGLGMAICYNIIKGHKGKIMVRNSDKRVEFEILLPMEKEGVKSNVI